jgi:hypothetical protein
MEKILQWLNKNILINFLIALAFFLVVVVFHDEVTILAINLRNILTLKGYNLFFTLFSILFFVAWIGWLAHKTKRTKEYRAMVWFMAPTMLLITLSFIFLQTFAIEAVHFFQYAILALLLFPLARSYGAAVFCATILGMIDELHQYIVLTPGFKYFDFNDILLNLLGAGMAAVSIRMTTGIRYSRRQSVRSVLGVATFLGTMMLFFGILYLAGYIRWNPDPAAHAPEWFTINRSAPSAGSWASGYKDNMIHVLNQWEGGILSLCLFAYYFLLDFLPETYFRPVK